MLRRAVGMAVALALGGGVSAQQRPPAGEAQRHYVLATAT